MCFTFLSLISCSRGGEHVVTENCIFLIIVFSWVREREREGTGKEKTVGV